MSAKKQSTDTVYELIYWPKIPGRGEFIRLAFEATRTPYTDVCNEREEGIQELCWRLKPEIVCSPQARLSQYPLFAPPILKVTETGHAEDDGAHPLLIHQTPNILIYLADKLGLDGANEAEGDKDHNRAIARQIMFTALDLNNEAHDTHHPVAVADYYEDQKDVALRRANDFRSNRIPKFFAYFERALKANNIDQRGQYFVGERLSIADIAVWQVLDGLKYAFPKELAARERDFPFLYRIFYRSFMKHFRVKEYLASDRRPKYSNGVFRHYPELDRQD